MRRILVAFAVLVFTSTLASTVPRPPLGLDLYRPAPDHNPTLPARIALGRRLFRERQLSRDGSRSCATCHDPARAFSDGRRVGRGVGAAEGVRNVPAMLNRAWGTTFFWDGRASTLERQVLDPIFDDRELGATEAQVLRVARSREYGEAFRESFGSQPLLDDVARALASYVRSVLAGDSPVDRYLAGDARALKPAGVRGLALFRGKAGCLHCHAGPLFTDEQFHNTGVAWRRGTWSDIGRAGVTHIPRDAGAFKTPTLREVARTAPYMHDGSIQTLQEVVDFYDRGGLSNPGLDARIRPLALTTVEKDDLVAFLRSLSGRIQEGR